MTTVACGIASIELVRNKLEDASVRVLRLETRCQTILTTVKNLEKLLQQINTTMSHMNEEIHNVNKWNNFYDGHLHDGYRGLTMLKESRDKKWKQYDDEARSIRIKISERQKEIQERQETYERNIEMIWKKIPTFVIKMEKQQIILSLGERLKGLAIVQERPESNASATLPQVTHDNLKAAKNKKLELESELARRKEELEHWQQKICEIQSNQNNSQEKEALENELVALKSIEMELHHKKESYAQHANEEFNARKEKEKSIEFNSNDDSGIMTMNDDISKVQEATANISLHEETLDQTMFDERPDPKMIEAPKTPSKNECTMTLGPMHSTPQRSSSKLSEFLRPKNSSHCSAPPNVTPITNLSLNNTSRMFTPTSSFQRLDTKGAIGKFSGLRQTTPLKKTISATVMKESTPIKSGFNRGLPTTPVAMLNKSKPMTITPAKKNSVIAFPMNKGLLAPTPEKETVINLTPTKQALSTPVAPSAPIKHSPAVSNRLMKDSTRPMQQEKQYTECKGDSNSNQPESKKLKPSNSFTKVQKPLSPHTKTTSAQSSSVSTPCTTASDMRPLQTMKPNECGDFEEATFSRVDRTDLDSLKVTSVGQNTVLPFGAMFRSSPDPMAVDSNQQDKCEKVGSPSPFDFNFAGGSAFGEESAFGQGSDFGAGSDFGGGSTFGGNSAFGSASGDSSSGFSSGFGGFNF